MESAYTVSEGSSCDENEGSSSSLRANRAHYRHSEQQIQTLENFFKDCPHPDEEQRNALSMDLGLEPKQIKFWFQNKRSQNKAKSERLDNTTLRAENERIKTENAAIKEALKSVICPECGGPPFGDEERKRSLQKLQLENAQLKEEHAKASVLLANYIGRPPSRNNPSLMPNIRGTSSMPSYQAREGVRNSTNVDELKLALDEIAPVPFQLRGILSNLEKAIMSDIVANAMDELLRLLRGNEHLWTQSALDGSHILHRENYDKMFPRVSHFRSRTARVESTKDSGIVSMNASSLVDKFLDPDKWMELFPTTVSKSEVLQVIEYETLASRGGTLKLMYAQMHIISPLVPKRDFYFLRYSQPMDHGTWVVVDVSYDSISERMPPSRSWRLPSGCMIQDLPNGTSKVTWIEHVEVDDSSQMHRLYKDLICACNAYGAKRWITSLQRTCERFNFTNADDVQPTHDHGGVINSPQARRSLMNFGLRLVKDYCSAISMAGELDFPQMSAMNSNAGVQISIHRGVEPSQPGGTIVTASHSIWLPLPPKQVFDWLKNVEEHAKWDILASHNPVHEIAKVINGGTPDNYTSIIRPFIATEKDMLICQESWVDPSGGGMLLYAPITMSAMLSALQGEDPAKIPILPSGFVVSSDGRIDSDSSGAGGSLLSVAFQILVSGPASPPEEVSLKLMSTVNTLLSSTIQKIKSGLGCSYIE